MIVHLIDMPIACSLIVFSTVLVVMAAQAVNFLIGTRSLPHSSEWSCIANLSGLTHRIVRWFGMPMVCYVIPVYHCKPLLRWPQ